MAISFWFNPCIALQLSWNSKVWDHSLLQIPIPPQVA